MNNDNNNKKGSRRVSESLLNYVVWEFELKCGDEIGKVLKNAGMKVRVQKLEQFTEGKHCWSGWW